MVACQEHALEVGRRVMAKKNAGKPAFKETWGETKA